MKTEKAEREDNGRIQAGTLRPLFSAELYPDFRTLVRSSAEKFAGKDAFLIKTRRARRGSAAEYRHITYRAFAEDIRALGEGLLDMGLLGQRFALLGVNRYEWILSCLTVLGGLGIAVPLDKGLPYEETLSSVERSRAGVLIFDPKHAETAKRLREECPTIRTFLCMEKFEDFDNLPSVIKRGRELLAENAGAPAGQAVSRYDLLPVDPDKTSVLVFTSGTTSRAKAVMLSQANILYDVYAMQLTQDIRESDVCMAFLPYHHTYGSGGQYILLAAGATTVFCDGLKYIRTNMQEYHVSAFIGVPLLIEAIWKRIWQGIEKEGKVRTFRRGVRLSNFLRRLHIDRRRQIFAEIHDQLGGRLSRIFSGASALDPVVQKNLEDIGIDVVQGYGMTEASPVICTEDAEIRVPGSIGKALPGVRLCIDRPNEDGIGELICQAPNVMLGYYEDPEETAKTLVDGWLRTGDLGRIGPDGCVYLTGRAKNVIVLKNGKNVYPEELETLIGNLPYVRENIVIGEPRHYDGNENDLALAAKIVYDPAYWKEVRGVTDPKEIEAFIRADLDRINETVPTYKKIYRLHIQDTEMKKTTTGKVRRFEEGARPHA